MLERLWTTTEMALRYPMVLDACDQLTSDGAILLKESSERATRWCFSWCQVTVAPQTFWTALRMHELPLCNPIFPATPSPPLTLSRSPPSHCCLIGCKLSSTPYHPSGHDWELRLPAFAWDGCRNAWIDDCCQGVISRFFIELQLTTCLWDLVVRWFSKHKETRNP